MRWYFWLVLALLSTNLRAQEASDTTPTSRPVPPVIAVMQAPVRVLPNSVIAGNTGVWLRLASKVKVKTIKVGDTLDFILDRDFYYRDTLLATAGTPVLVTVKEIATARTAQRGSKLVITFQGLKLVNGQVLPLRGDASYKGGAGVAGQILGGMGTGGGGENPLMLAVPPVLLVALFTHGKNRDLPVGTIAVAYIDGDFNLDSGSLQAFQPPPVGLSTAKVYIVRGRFEPFYSRDLYCNGVPLAHLDSKRMLELELKPGYYRFAINPNKGVFEIYLRAGTEIKLFSDARHVYELSEHERNVNTAGIGHHDAEQLLHEARPVEKTDLYGTECNPLPEEITKEPDDSHTSN